MSLWSSSQSRYFPQSRYSKKMRARKGAAGGEPEGYAGRKIRIKLLMRRRPIGTWLMIYLTPKGSILST